MRACVFVVAVLLSAMLFSSGCQSMKRVNPWVKSPASTSVTNGTAAVTAPQPVLSPEEKQRKVKNDIKNLERAIDQQHSELLKIDRDLKVALDDLTRAREQARVLEQKTNSLALAQTAGRAKLQTLETDLIQQRTQLTDYIKASATLGSPRDVAALQQALEQERQMRATQEVIAQQQSKEVEDLRKALAARDEMVQKQPAAPASTLVAPVEEKNEIKMVEEAKPPLDAPQPVKAETLSVAAASTTTIVSATASGGGQKTSSELVADGNQKLKEGDLDGAEKLFETALAQNPSLLGAQLGLAACHYGWGELQKAKQIVDAIIKQEANNAQALGLRAMIYWRENDVSSAGDLLSKALKIAPNDSQLHNYMGIVLDAKKKRDEAVVELSKAVALDANNSEAQFNLAVLLATARVPKLEEAKQHYEAALRMGNERDPALDKILYPPAPAK